jgi:hypothetical protein
MDKVKDRFDSASKEYVTDSIFGGSELASW